MNLNSRVALLTLLIAAGCGESATEAPLTAPTAEAAKNLGPSPTGERITGQTALIPIYDWNAGLSGSLLFGSTPKGVALWPAHADPQAQATFYLIVYPIGANVPLQCYDVPNETCPDHGPVIAGGAMQIMPGVYGGGVLGHNHLSPPHGKGFHVTEYPVLVLFTSPAAAQQHLTTKSQVEAAAGRREVILGPFQDFSFLNALVDARVYEIGTPWVCPAYTFCPS
jgi:hypothetical protein